MSEDRPGTLEWYVVHTYSGYENKVKDNLEKAVENNGMQNLITEVMVPTEEVVEIRNGKRVTTQHKTFPGYVLVHMIITNESWYVVRNTRGVTGFVEMPQAGQTACGRICAGDAERGGDAKQQRRKESVHGSSEVSRTKLRNLPRNRNSCGREFAALPAGEEPVSRVLLSGADAECAQIG